MRIHSIPLSFVKVGDHFMLGGRLYRVEAITQNAYDQIRIEFIDPNWMTSFRHYLEMDPGFPFEVIRTN